MKLNLKDKFIVEVCHTCDAYFNCPQDPSKITQCATLILWNNIR